MTLRERGGDPSGSVEKQFQSVMTLTKAELQSYAEKGFVLRKCCFSQHELRTLQEAAEAASRSASSMCAEGREYLLDGHKFVDVENMTVQFEHQRKSSLIRVIEPVHQLHTDLEALVRDERLVAPMRQLVGAPEVALWTNKLNLKPAQVGSGFGWHQDSPYWMHDCSHVDRLPNVMVYLDAATIDNGCLRVIEGSHREGMLPGRFDGSQLGGFYTDPGAFEADREVALVAPAGSLIFFSPHVVHGSLPNKASNARRGLIVTYQPAGQPMLKTGKVCNVG